jgi:hypothetical protein
LPGNRTWFEALALARSRDCTAVIQRRFSALSERLRAAQGLKHVVHRKVRPSSTGPYQAAPDTDFPFDSSEASMSIQSLRTHFGVTLVAATLAVLIAIGLLGGLVALFVNDGMPLERAVVAERACGDAAFVSEREACVRAFAAASSRSNVASR